MDSEATSTRTEQTFPVTQWAMVEAACNPKTEVIARARLIEAYLPALEAHIRRQFALPQDQALDILHSFFLEKVMEKGLLRAADKARGKFRSFLARSLQNYVIQHVRRDAAIKRAPTNNAICLDELVDAELASGQEHDTSEFDADWARSLFEQTLRCMHAECSQYERMDLWRVFEERLLRPLLGGVEATDYTELTKQYGYQSNTQVANALTTAKRMFARHLRQQVAKYVCGDDADVEAELRELKEILVKVGAGDPPAMRS